MPGKNESVLLTGATGFVGSRLAMRLIADGCIVHAVVRPGSDRSQLTAVRDQVVFHAHDGTTEALTEIVARAQPEVVFHLASLFVSEHRAEHIAPLVESNLLFGTQLLEAIKTTGVRRLVNTGTSWEHFQNQAYNPVNLYAATKSAFESVARYYQETSSMEMVTLKLFDTYGPGDPRKKLVHLLKRVADSGEQLSMSAGEQLIDLVYIDDVVEAFILAAEVSTERRHEAYAVSSGEQISLIDLATLVGRVLRKNLNIEWGGRPYRDREVFEPWTKGRSLPGWVPRIAVTEGLSRVFTLC